MQYGESVWGACPSATQQKSVICGGIVSEETSVGEPSTQQNSQSMENAVQLRGLKEQNPSGCTNHRSKNPLHSDDAKTTLRQRRCIHVYYEHREGRGKLPESPTSKGAQKYARERGGFAGAEREVGWRIGKCTHGREGERGGKQEYTTIK